MSVADESDETRACYCERCGCTVAACVQQNYFVVPPCLRSNGDIICCRMRRHDWSPNPRSDLKLVEHIWKRKRRKKTKDNDVLRTPRQKRYENIVFLRYMFVVENQKHQF
jgi:hypothetical protein